MKKILIAGIFIISFMGVAFADTSIKAEADKTSITTDETLTYKIIITSSDKNLPTPQIPKFIGFNVTSQAQSSTVSFAEGKVKSILVYAFILTPTDIGKFKIEPSSIKIRNKTYSSDAFEIEVTQGKTKPKPEKKPATPLKPALPEETKEPQVTL